MPVSIRLSSDIEQRLTYLANATGRPKTFYLRKLIEDNLDDLEDVYLAEQALERLREGQDRVLNSDEFWRALES